MSHNLAVCPVCGGNEIEREECTNCGIPVSRFVERKTGRGGLRNPPGGRPPKEQKFRKRLISLPPEIAEKLDQVENASNLITQLLTQYFERTEQ